MDTNEIMVNEEVIELIDDISTEGYGKVFKVTAGVGLVVIGGFVAYKYVIKPAIVKIKTKREQQKTDVDFTYLDDNEDTEIEE